MSQHAHTNRLVDSTSPYLKQHAHNPVDWYPWGPEALNKSRELDRPIFLSIGYSACHWCHVMEHESFEDADTAEYLNENFVCIKVDREERPDLDHIYMTAVQMMTGQGGWPMSVFLTPDLRPFFGGTYFPPEPRYQRPSFMQVLGALVDAWQNRRDQLDAAAGQLTDGLHQVTRIAPAEGPADLKPELLKGALGQLHRAFDATYGGFGSAPKFPHSMELQLLLRLWQRFGANDALDMVKLTLDRMAMGGIYDQLGGGFHRYSTDARWLVPHFEKMLYDNALLTVAYLEAFQATGDPFYKEVVAETLGYVRREMTSVAGPFFSTQDADSEGVEGKFFVWTLEEVEEVLGGDEAKLFAEIFDVTADGNWEGNNILNRAKTYAQSARLLKMDEPELRRRLSASRKKLFDVRSRRIWPGRDEKVLTAWNGLMINAFARAAQVLDDASYAETAAKAADFILAKMRAKDGRLYRTWSQGSAPALNAYLEDYAYFIDALVSLYEATFEPRWLDEALALARVLREQFWDEGEGGFFYTGADHEQLIARLKDTHDSSVPSGNAMAVTALLRLGKLTGNQELLEQAERTLKLLHGLMSSSPLAAGQLLLALDFYLGPVQEIVVVGAREHADTRRVLRAVHAGFRPHQVVACRGTEAPGSGPLDALFAGKEMRGDVTTYVCENFACQEPLVGAAAAEAALRK